MYQSIVVATDLSPVSSSAIDAGVALSKALSAKLSLLHVYDLPILPFLDGAIVPPPDYLAQVMKESDRRLIEVRDSLRAKGVSVETYTRTGAHIEQILQGIKTLHADLLIVSTHGRTGASRLLLGSVAERLVRLAPIPVLVVNKEEDSSEEGITGEK